MIPHLNATAQQNYSNCESLFESVIAETEIVLETGIIRTFVVCHLLLIAGHL